MIRILNKKEYEKLKRELKEDLEKEKKDKRWLFFYLTCAFILLIVFISGIYMLGQANYGLLNTIIIVLLLLFAVIFIIATEIMEKIIDLH